MIGQLNARSLWTAPTLRTGRKHVARTIGMIVLGLATMLVGPVHAGRAEADPVVGRVGLQMCHLTVHFLNESDGQRMYRERWLPKSQPLSLVGGWPPYSPGSASLTIWVLACDRVDINGRSVGSGVLSLTGIQLQDRAYAVVPTHWDNYLVWAHTNNAELGKALTLAKLPAFTVPDMHFSWRVNGGLTSVEVPWGRSPFGLSVTGSVMDVPHVHDNTFQHGRAPGVGPRLELVIGPLVPRDRFCIPTINPGCMAITTKPGTSMARFLGRATYSLGADHETISQATINLLD